MVAIGVVGCSGELDEMVLVNALQKASLCAGGVVSGVDEDEALKIVEVDCEHFEILRHQGKLDVRAEDNLGELAFQLDPLTTISLRGELAGLHLWAGTYDRADETTPVIVFDAVGLELDSTVSLDQMLEGINRNGAGRRIVAMARLSRSRSETTFQYNENHYVVSLGYRTNPNQVAGLIRRVKRGQPNEALGGTQPVMQGKIAAANAFAFWGSSLHSFMLSNEVTDGEGDFELIIRTCTDNALCFRDRLPRGPADHGYFRYVFDELPRSRALATARRLVDGFSIVLWDDAYHGVRFELYGPETSPPVSMKSCDPATCFPGTCFDEHCRYDLPTLDLETPSTGPQISNLCPGCNLSTHACVGRLLVPQRDRYMLSCEPATSDPDDCSHLISPHCRADPYCRQEQLGKLFRQCSPGGGCAGWEACLSISGKWSGKCERIDDHAIVGPETFRRTNRDWFAHFLHQEKRTLFPCADAS